MSNQRDPASDRAGVGTTTHSIAQTWMPTAVQPFTADGPAGHPAGRDRTGVLLCHGFTGSPASLRPWADALAAAGFTVRLPLLPGHGTRWQDMNETTFDDWLDTVLRGVTELNSRCDRVVLCGLSMGGTLTLRVAELHPDQIDGLVLVNPSVMSTRLDAKVAPLLRLIRPVLLKVMPSMPGIVDDIKKPGGAEFGYDRLPVAAGLSLQAAWKVVRRDLGRVMTPMLLLHSVVDHVVEPENAAIVLAEISSRDVREVLLENSFHVATLDNDAELIQAESIAFLDRLAGT